METYRWLVILLGLPVLSFSLYQIFSAPLNVNLILLTAFTSLIATRITIKFPNFNGSITVSDAFTFISLLTWGAPAAVFTAMAESLTLTIRLRSKLVRTYLFNISSSIINTWLTGQILFYAFGPPDQLSAQLPLFPFTLAICLMAMSYFAGNMLMTATMQVLKLKLALWKTWSRYYLWTCVTFFVGAALAGVSVKLFDLGGLLAILLVLPILFLFYTAYQSYIRTVDALQASESRFRSSFDYAAIGMGIVSTEGKWLKVNKSLEEILGIPEKEFLAAGYQDFVHPENLAEVQRKTRELFEEKIPAFQTEIRLLNKKGEDVWVLLGASTAHDSQGTVRHLIFQIQDITSRKLAEEKLWFDANHDALTGLPNRSAFLDRLTTLINGQQTFENPLFAVLFLDLDGFKLVNDSLGHGTGDELLKGTSHRLLECIRGNDMVARLGGDEFTILLVNLNDISQAITVAERIREKLTRAFNLGGQELYIGTSIGIAASNLGYEKASDILRDADAAMYQAKAQGKGCYSLFNQSINDQATKHLRLTSDLRLAIERRELIARYQPIYSIETGLVTGFEALVRWNHPVFGLLSPAEFIPLAEENGLVSQIDEWTLETATRQMKKWKLDEPEAAKLFISVNLSSRQFEKTSLFDTVKRILIDTELSPQFLQLEITETALIKNLKNTAQVLKELNFLGVRIALDDFGTGYSSLNYLHELPISVLKIDRSFIQRIKKRDDEAEVLRAIISLAKNLKLETVAEGVETDEQFHLLEQLECRFGQGYLFSPPLLAEEVPEFLRPDKPGNSLIHTPPHFKNGLRLVSGS